MSNILEFPSREKQAYAFLTENLAALLKDKGADETLIAHATALLLKVYGEAKDTKDFSFSVDLPDGLTPAQIAQLQQQIEAGADAQRKHHHSLMIRMAAQLLLTELKLFQHVREEPR
ncbi:hypothetical protein N9L12_04845 [Luminiphilus sp.]|nr:hypothetical protein [Luminiphilus sp.]